MSVYASDFEIARNSSHSFLLYFLLEILITCFLPKLLTFLLENSKISQKSNHFCLECTFSSNFQPSRNFRTKKSEPRQKKTRDQYCEEKLKEKSMVRILSRFKIRCAWWHVSLSPSMTFMTSSTFTFQDRQILPW